MRKKRKGRLGIKEKRPIQKNMGKDKFSKSIHKEFWGAVGFILFFLVFTLVLLQMGCDGGWSVGGLDIPEKL